jgi:hypothetical protein
MSQDISWAPTVGVDRVRPVDVDFANSRAHVTMTQIRRTLARRLMVAAALGLAAGAMLIDSAAAQEFSATLVANGTEDMATGAPGRINVSGDKVRLETPELVTGFFLVDVGADTAYFVRPTLHTYMEARQSSVLAQIFVPLDPDNPCARWQTMAKLSGATANGKAWQCERTGEETLDGHPVTTWRAVSPQQRTFVAWIDRTLKFPLRITTNLGTSFSLTGIVQASQPTSLFRLPPNFKKFDPQGLIDRIKQSDVWVEPVH